MDTIELRSLLNKAFAAGRDYQIGEYSEYHGGREHNYPNFDKWYNEQITTQTSDATISGVGNGVVEYRDGNGF